jgi:SEC-C motif-containing protein
MRMVAGGIPPWKASHQRLPCHVRSGQLTLQRLVQPSLFYELPLYLFWHAPKLLMLVYRPERIKGHRIQSIPALDIRTGRRSRCPARASSMRSSAIGNVVSLPLQRKRVCCGTFGKVRPMFCGLAGFSGKYGRSPCRGLRTSALAVRQSLLAAAGRHSRHRGRSSVPKLTCRGGNVDEPRDQDNDLSGSILPRGALFGGFLSYGVGKKRTRSDRVPQNPEIPCACGSGRTYRNCCMPFHTNSKAPAEAEELLRARYSAFAYRLPGFIMRTTSKTNPDYTDDWNRWEADILEFCDLYRFPGMEVLDEKTASPDVSFIQFRANLIYEGALGFFIERSRFVKERGKWMYASGKLVEAEMPPR